MCYKKIKMSHSPYYSVYYDYIYPKKYGVNTILYNNKSYAQSCNSLEELYIKIKTIAKI